MENVTMEFPGLGIGEFTVNKIIAQFNLFGLTITLRWYALIITTGMLLACLYAYKRSKFENIKTDDLLDIALYTIAFGIVGARLYYVLTTLGNYDSFIDVIAIWNGGLAIYGGIIAGVTTVYVICRIKKIKFFKALDMAAPAAMIGQILGRWGNFFNGEAYGYAMKEGDALYFLRMGLIPNVNSQSKMYYFHPTFLYESVWNLIGFLIINALYKKKKFDGQIFFMYITWYGFGRMIIEGLRTDSLYVGTFRISQIVGFLCFALGCAALIYNFINVRKAELAKADYEAAYPQFKTEAVLSSEAEITKKSEGGIDDENAITIEMIENNDAAEPELNNDTADDVNNAPANETDSDNINNDKNNNEKNDDKNN